MKCKHRIKIGDCRRYSTCPDGEVCREAFQAGYNEGFHSGYEDCKKNDSIIPTCDICGRTITKDTKKRYKHIDFGTVREVCLVCSGTGLGDEWMEVEG